MLGTADLRTRFAARLAELYGSEVPAYNTLVEVARAVNTEVLRTGRAQAERLGSIDRVSAERHGAIRVGSPRELAQLARVFAAFGMYPVGFYDLREGIGKGVPVVSTAFRPIDGDELATNPFRVFTSMLTVDDARFFDVDTRRRLDTFIESRRLFSPELLALAEQATDQGGLCAEKAEDLLEHATNAFRLSAEPVDKAWHNQLSAISSVAADIAGTRSTHINHLTPRVLDIDELYRRMQDQGIQMIEQIQGPPSWAGPDVLLRQTSFKALAERRMFRLPDGRSEPGSLRVRFGEVEQRGIALTARGLQRYENAMRLIARRVAEGPHPADQPALARAVWRESFPDSELGLALGGLGWFSYRVGDIGDRSGCSARPTLSDLIASGVLLPEPIVYEDFLPRSAAGIFQSNLTASGRRADHLTASHYDRERLSGILDRAVMEPMNLYRGQQDASLRAASSILGFDIFNDLTE